MNLGLYNTLGAKSLQFVACCVDCSLWKCRYVPGLVVGSRG